MAADAGIPIAELHVDGGASVNNLMLQFQADILDATLLRPAVTESTAWGAAMLAGLSTGFWERLIFPWYLLKLEFTMIPS